MTGSLRVIAAGGHVRDIQYHYTLWVPSYQKIEFRVEIAQCTRKISRKVDLSMVTWFVVTWFVVTWFVVTWFVVTWRVVAWRVVAWFK